MLRRPELLKKREVDVSGGLAVVVVASPGHNALCVVFNLQLKVTGVPNKARLDFFWL